MHIRKYKTTDCSSMAKLFYETVHTVNAKDYTKAQLDVWATGNVDLAAFDKSFLAHNTLVAQEDNIIVGFGDMNDSGYLDRLYIHKDFQNKGIATAIVNKLEGQAALAGIVSFTTHASITAKPFFEKRGYIAIRENAVFRSGIKLTNFIMEKRNGR
ncbi:MAG: GNAT family N-acetyltransferase [Oscillospiraceae bacterium]